MALPFLAVQIDRKDFFTTALTEHIRSMIERENVKSNSVGLTMDSQ